jgi:hypothetical protein
MEEFVEINMNEEFTGIAEQVLKQQDEEAYERAMDILK